MSDVPTRQLIVYKLSNVYYGKNVNIIGIIYYIIIYYNLLYYNILIIIYYIIEYYIDPYNNPYNFKFAVIHNTFANFCQRVACGGGYMFTRF
jgi:hypothetical protein